MKQNRQELERIYHNFNDVSTPDPDFNPARNKAVIEKTIRDTEMYFSKVHSVLDDELGARIDAVSTYGCYRFNKGEKSPKDYFGKKLYEEFIGEKILSKIRVMDSVRALNRKNGNDKFINSFLL